VKLCIWLFDNCLEVGLYTYLSTMMLNGCCWALWTFGVCHLSWYLYFLCHVCCSSQSATALKNMAS